MYSTVCRNLVNDKDFNPIFINKKTGELIELSYLYKINTDYHLGINLGVNSDYSLKIFKTYRDRFFIIDEALDKIYFLDRFKNDKNTLEEIIKYCIYDLYNLYRCESCKHEFYVNVNNTFINDCINGCKLSRKTLLEENIKRK